MTSWLLIAWLCTAPGQCQWEIVGRGFQVEADCLQAAFAISRHAECVTLTVPIPGRPR
jgi:hypothetical protein